MGQTAIGWTATVLSDGTVLPGYSFNPWIGCAKVSAGCTNCYAERENRRYHWINGWGPQGERKRTSAANWRQVMSWFRTAQRDGVRRKVFCASLADVFEDRDDLRPWRSELWDLIVETHGQVKAGLDWLLLTKRPENVQWMVPPSWMLGFWPRNVWLGVTAENQQTADERIPLLLQVPAKVRFVSCEPLLGLVDLTDLWGERRIYRGDSVSGVLDYQPCPDWIIAGGESGPNARLCHSDWVRSLRDQCQTAGVPFFWKQWGEWTTEYPEGNLNHRAMTYEHGETFYRVGRKAAGDSLDGRKWHEFPEVTAT